MMRMRRRIDLILSMVKISMINIMMITMIIITMIIVIIPHKPPNYFKSSEGQRKPQELQRPNYFILSETCCGKYAEAAKNGHIFNS
jgi:hypothetical protein